MQPLSFVLRRKAPGHNDNDNGFAALDPEGAAVGAVVVRCGPLAGFSRWAGWAAVAAGLAALAPALPAQSQDIDDVRRLSGRELDEAWANRATTADEAITKLVRNRLAELNVGTPNTEVRFIPYEEVPIEEECRTILKGKDYRLTSDELPSTVTLQWGNAPAGGFAVSTALRYDVNERRREDNALKFFSYPTLLAEPLDDGTYHAQVLIPTGSVLAQLAAIGKLYETGQTVRLDRSNSDYVSPKGWVTAVRLDDKVQRVVRDHFLPLEAFVSHPKHSPRWRKTRFKLGYFKSLDVALVVNNRVYDIFLIRKGGFRLSRSEPWTFIQNAKTYNHPAYQRRLRELCVTVFPERTPTLEVAAAAAKPADSATSGQATPSRAAPGDRQASEWDRALRKVRRSLRQSTGVTPAAYTRPEGAQRNTVAAGLRRARAAASRATQGSPPVPAANPRRPTRTVRNEDADMAEGAFGTAAKSLEQPGPPQGPIERRAGALRPRPIFSDYPDIEN